MYKIYVMISVYMKLISLEVVNKNSHFEWTRMQGQSLVPVLICKIKTLVIWGVKLPPIYYDSRLYA